MFCLGCFGFCVCVCARARVCVCVCVFNILRVFSGVSVLGVFRVWGCRDFGVWGVYRI